MTPNPQYSRQYYEDLLLDALLDKGFTVDEALSLIALQERVEEEWAAQQEAERRRRIARWRNPYGDYSGRSWLS